MKIIFSVNGLTVESEVYGKIKTKYSTYYKGRYKGEVHYFDKKYCTIKTERTKEVHYGIQSRRESQGL